MTPLYLTEEQRQKLLKHIEKKRYNAKISLLFFSIFTIPLLLICGEGIHLTLQGVRIAEKLGSASMISSIFLAVIQLASYGAFGLLLLYECGGKEFLIHSDMDCLKYNAYELDVIPFVRKSEAIDYPYYFYDIMDREYLCPVYEDWKLADSESEILLITLKNKNRYALRYTN